MKILFAILLTISSVFALSTQSLSTNNEQLENERLCKVFTKKVEIYKKNIREDAYAAQTLHSYETRASLYCKE